MNGPFVRRLGAVALSSAVAIGSSLALGGNAVPAEATSPTGYEATAADWLASQLTDGVVHNQQYDFDDLGLSLDVYLALSALHARSAAADSVITHLRRDPEAYISYDGAHFAGATGKLATAVETAGADPTDFGGVDLVRRLEGLVDTTHPHQLGRGIDTGSTDYSNTIGQGWVVRALAGAHSDLTPQAVAFLVKQRCAAGFFRETPEAATDTASRFTCNGDRAATPSIDSTSLAIQALLVARAHGVSGITHDIRAATAWLVRQQRSNGSFVGNGTQNSNTTGLAAVALARTGHPVQAARARAWLTRLQVTPAVAAASPALVAATGAVAYDASALTRGRADGITADARDQWQRATSQAALGLASVRSLRLGVPHGYLAGGSRVTVHLDGLGAGERYAVRVDDRPAVRGTASLLGTAAPRVPLPNGTAAHTVSAVGSVSGLTGTTTVRALGAKRLSVHLASPRVPRSHMEVVTVTGLASREHSTLFYRGHRIWSGAASAHGRVVRTFRVGRSLGAQRVTLRGRFASRYASTTVRVVR